MNHFKRVAAEHASQAFSIAILLVDRLLLTAILYRFWGTSKFEAWSVCLAFAGLLSLFEFGFNMYFGNRLMIETENGRTSAAQRTVRIGNALFALSAIASIVATVLWLLLFGSPAVSGEPAADNITLILLMSLLASMRLSMASIYGVYRANRQFGRLALVHALGELVRIIAVAAVVALGGGLVQAGVAALATTACIQCFYVVFDLRNRFSIDPFGFALPTRAEMREILAMSTAYFAQQLPLIVLTHVPVLVVIEQSTASGVLAGFVLLRTLAGLPRALLQSLSVVVGFECARRLAVRDQVGAFSVLSSGGRIFSVLSGLAAGVLLGAGSQIVTVWTGNPNLYRLDYLVAALLPMLIASTSVLMHNVLSSNNTPYLAAAGRVLQLAMTAVIAAGAQIPDPGLRMLVALSVGEVLGFTPLAYYAVAQLIPRAGVTFHIVMVALTSVAAALAWLASVGAMQLVPPESTSDVILALALAGACCGGLFIALGLSSSLRGQIIRAALARFRRGFSRQDLQ